MMAWLIRLLTKGDLQTDPPSGQHRTLVHAERRYEELERRQRVLLEEHQAYLAEKPDDDEWI